MAFRLGKRELEGVYQHVFLPPKLPQEVDGTSDSALINITLNALAKLSDDNDPVLCNAITAIKNLKAINSLPNAAVSESQLTQILTSLPSGRTAPVHVTSQNSAVLATRKQDELVFEVFELSPLSSRVMTAKGRLVRSFPGTAVSVNTKSRSLGDFIPVVANTLSTMCKEAVASMQPITYKAGTKHGEGRDTTNPAIVTELFFAFLRGVGSPVSVCTISKNTRDDVLWNDAEFPWRRSSMWLLIKVALHLVVSRSPGGTHQNFKVIMVFILGHILGAAAEQDFPSEDLQAMSAKIVRRIHKLHSAKIATDHTQSKVLDMVNSTLAKTSALVSGRWQTIQENGTLFLDMSGLAKVNINKDTQIKLTALDKYIRLIHSRSSAVVNSTFAPPSGLRNYEPTSLPVLHGSNHAAFHYATSNLQQFELWVAQHLEQWVSHKAQRVTGPCQKLQDLMTQYHRLSSIHYAKNPEGLSVIILTLLDIWVACDKIAVNTCAMLADYAPEIPMDMLQNLLLPYPFQMERLHKLEVYLTGRSQASRSDLAGLQFSTNNPNSFAVRYYGQSPSHQRLKRIIEQDAQVANNNKRSEYQTKKSEYDRLDALYDSTDCGYVTVIIDRWCDPPETEQRHDRWCSKCRYRRERDDLSIKLHEWPLPAQQIKAKAVVFELEVPLWYVAWRDSRSFLLQDVLKGKRDSARLDSKYQLSVNDPHLTRRCTAKTGTERIGLVSQTKPVVVTHYSTKKIPGVDVDDVCVPSGLNYEYFDESGNHFVGSYSFDDKVAKSCTYLLPMSELRRYVFRPARSPDGELPNSVIASQDKCSESMSLDEYKELCGVPLGHNIQWVNILQQLAMPGVDFKRIETNLVFLQCIYQTGPPGQDYYRQTHAILQNTKKASDLISHLDAAVDRVKQNWESAQAFSLFASVATRVLCLKSPTFDACSVLLAKIRVVSSGWMHSLREAAHKTSDHDSREMFFGKSVEAALICASTYDVPKKHIDGLLESRKDVSMLIQATLVVQHGGNAKFWKDQALNLMRLRFVRFLDRYYKSISGKYEGIDDAIKQSWSAYKPGPGGWSTVSPPQDDWITSETKGNKQVHYNLLSGELLVNGVPLDQPPQSYRTLPLYKTPFGDATVEVMPATSTGFDYSTKREYGGHGVQIGLHTENGRSELLVQGEHASGILEIVPSRLLAEDFPTHFAQQYVHWYSHNTGDVELRPTDDAWNSHSPAKWTLRKTGGGGWRLLKDGNAVVGLQTPTSRAISSILRPLANARRTHCVLQTDGKTLKIEIPTIRLGFQLIQGHAQLRSKEFPSMIIGSNQGLGALVGMENKLMLISENGERTMLLPEAKITYSKHESHVSVRIPTVDAIQKVHAVHVDQRLGRLVDSGDLGCKLYIAYLHALTSFCLPDSLTSTTGVEQALSILDSCAVRSFSQLSQENIDMLALIAALSPGRSYYPTHMKVMQTVIWNSELGFMTQHARLRISVQEIFDQARDAEMFYPELQLSFPRMQQCDPHLQQRDNMRSSTFRVSEFGAEDHSLQHDTVYAPRDCSASSERASRAAIMSNMMTRSGTDMHFESKTLRDLWQNLCNISNVEGPDASLASSQYRYGGSLTQDKKFHLVLAKLLAHLRKLKQSTTRQERNFVAMWLASMAFADDTDTESLQLLAMACRTPELTPKVAPTADSFVLSHGTDRTRYAIEAIVNSNLRGIEDSPEFDTPRRKNEPGDNYRARRRALWEPAQRVKVVLVVNALVAQWTQRHPDSLEIPDVNRYIRVEAAMALIKQKFQAWHDNNLLYKYFSFTTQALDYLDTDPVVLQPVVGLTAVPSPSLRGHVTTEDLFTTMAPQTIHPPSQPEIHDDTMDIDSTSPTTEVPRLRKVIEALDVSAGSSAYEQSYGADLKTSLHALGDQQQKPSPVSSLTPEVLKSYRDVCRMHISDIYEQLASSIHALPHSTIGREAQHFPRVSPLLFLQQLAHDRVNRLSPSWKASIVAYGVALTALQRAERLVRLAEGSQHLDLLKEYQNSGHQNWDPLVHTELLLMEIESGIMIREVQEQIASEMRSPSSSGANAVMQLNMGEGKSTVIIPMVAAALADGSQVVRVIVAKPQSKQVAQMLLAKLGGLVKRRVYYMPFSRSLKLTNTAAATMSRTMKNCMRRGGILLVQPEHILSFGLMAPECYITDKESVGQPLMAMQDFFDQYSRDIVDESDENFSVRFELIYTMGSQQIIELSPDRWFFVQQVLGIVMQVVREVSKEHPCSIEVRPNGPGAFPRVRLLRADASHTLMHKVADHIREHGFEGIPMARQSENMRLAVSEYISNFEPSKDTTQLVEAGEFWEACKAQILLLRGIIAGGVLAFALSQKRWRVNYGLALRNPPTKLAVPYRAKDSPSPSSEFSHPDVVVVLTSLCYYYEGLSDDDMFTVLGHLVDTDQADAEYQAWVKNAPGLPVAFQQLQGINLKDRLQCILQLFPHLRNGKAVVDYFLSHIIFPKEMKQFPDKLSVSGWDIGKEKKHVTTGFSGTNDSRRLLPLFVTQLDLPEQKHTNALVLEYLLQPVNGVELLSTTPAALREEQSSDAQHLLSAVMMLDPPVQVILDVGAQILEYDNLGLAKEWLKLSDASKEAAVFVNASDELCVVDRKGRFDLLQTSPFASRLDACLAFLDESHTRGIDLKLPLNYRAAVTLGAHLSKDRLVQACMRMRKLGQGQSVVFCISPEIQAKIQENMKPYTQIYDIGVADVLLWSISETHAETRRSMPLWKVQGERFVAQSKIWKSMQNHNGETSLSKSNAELLLEEEAQSIEYRYRPRQEEDVSSQRSKTDDADLKRIYDHCQEFDGLTFNASTLQEEQERELSPEIEEERQVQKAPAASPARHELHQDVVVFAISGEIRQGSSAYMPAFESLGETTAASEINVRQLVGKRNLFVTADFARTVTKSGRNFISDTFQRNVQWVITRRTNTAPGTQPANFIMVVSEYEANLLLPRMTNTITALHKYKPRSNAGYKPLDKLDLFTASANQSPPVIPGYLSSQLRLFAGQLYISTYDDYLEICRFLGLSAMLLTSTMEAEGWKVGSDGFILRDEKGRTGGSSGLTKSPMNFFKILMSKVRMNGNGISKTDMGRLLEGKPFQESEWQA
ncbi:hypothetical protein Q7P35_004870 [Cladosporium inversicolor]